MEEKIKMKVDVIMPCFNGENKISRCLDSFLNQTFKDYKIYFIDDGSTDKTKDIALMYKKKFEEIGVPFDYLYKENGGATSAVNVGLKEDLQGEYLLSMDSDDVLPKYSLEHRVKFLDENKRYSAVGGWVYSKNYETGKIIRIEKCKAFSGNKSETVKNIILCRNLVFAGYLFRKKEFFNSVGRNIYESMGGQNFQILIPFAHNFLFKILDEVTMIITVENDSHSSINMKTKEKFLQYEDRLCKIVSETLNKMKAPQIYYDWALIRHNFNLMNLGYKFKDQEIFDENYKILKKNTLVKVLGLKSFVKRILMKIRNII